jgi:hypothetical protein
MLTSHMPRHFELMRVLFDRVGWDPDSFHALRLLVQYAPIPGTVLLCSELPEKPPPGGGVGVVRARRFDLAPASCPKAHRREAGAT